MATTIDAPRSPYTRSPQKRGVNWEKWGWIYMRVSGVLLVGDGVSALDFAFVAGKLTNPFWQWWDVAMLWLALIHGGNGMRTLVNDYSTGRIVNPLLKWALLVSTAVLIILGTLVIFTFDPCPTVAADSADLLPSFCAAGR